MIKARTKIGIADLAVCVIAVLLALVLLFIPKTVSGNTVHVKTDSSDFYLSLTKDHRQVISSAGHTLTLEIQDGKVRISESDCQDKLCVSSGWISDSARIIVCAPAEVLIRITEGGGEADADVIAGR